ncbi:MAG: molecular chaperone DnaJ, partial [Cyanobacteriota bacterium]|nr:molecular chaperone DnaJ [Cyanobacteriota bacterium]
MKSSDKDNNGKRKISLQLSEKLVAGIDRLRSEWGLRSRGDTVERLIGELLVEPQPADLDDDTPVEAATPSEAVAIDEGFDEGGALVLLAQPSQGGLAVNFIEGQSRGAAVSSKGTGGPAIDLPGFVRRQSEQLKRSLQPPAPRETVERDPLPLVDSSSLKAALVAAQQHWIDLYGTAPNEHVLEASMRWLAKDIWPQLDQSDGRPFTWTLACRLIEELAPSWPAGEPTFARVMTMAGLLEDPFSSATLSLRL